MDAIQHTVIQRQRVTHSYPMEMILAKNSTRTVCLQTVRVVLS